MIKASKNSHFKSGPAAVVSFCGLVLAAALLLRSPSQVEVVKLPPSSIVIAPGHPPAPVDPQIQIVEESIQSAEAAARAEAAQEKKRIEKVQLAKRQAQIARKKAQALKEKKRRAQIAALKRAQAERTFLNSELARVPSPELSLATNSWQPEDQWIQAALGESVLAPRDYSDLSIAEAQLDIDLALRLEQPEETNFKEVVSRVQKNPFKELRENLEALTVESIVWAAAPRPEPTLVRPEPTPTAAQAPRGRVAASSGWKSLARQPVRADSKHEAPTATAPAATTPKLDAPQLVARTADASEPQLVAADSREPGLVATGATEPALDISDIAEPGLVATNAAEPAAVEPELLTNAPTPSPRGGGLAPRLAAAPLWSVQRVDPTNSPVASTAPAFGSVYSALPRRRGVAAASLPSAEVSTQPDATPAGLATAGGLIPDGLTPDGLTERTLAVAVDKPAPAKAPVDPDREFDTDLFGRVTLSDEMSAFLAAERGHLELYLQPMGTRDPQGTRYLAYRFPQKDFREQAASLKGRYRLVAGIFRPQDVDVPYAEVVYPDEINFLTAREHLKFHVDMESLRVVSHPGGADRRYVSLSLSFFEGAASDHREPKSISGVSVEVVGFPEYGTLSADTAGNLVVKAIPNHSQVVLKASAPGYFPTYRTVPIFGGDTHLPVYLIARSQVDSLTRLLVGVRQAAPLSIVMGRVFDPQSRNPLQEERVELAEHPMDYGAYFSLFQDPMVPRTGPTGFYSFFNVAPAFRYLARPDSDRRVLRLNVQPGSGYYVELGRGGMKSLKGRLIDPNLGNVGGARIWLAGDDSFETSSDSEGRFEIPGLDFPSGVVAIDVQAEGYPLSRHTLPWNPRRAAGERDLFLVQNHFVEQSIASSQTAEVGPNLEKFERVAGRGNLIGGAYGALFEGLNGCLRVELWSVDQARTVHRGHGPFPFRGGRSFDGPLCLTAEKAGFNYLNLPPGEYLLKWKNDAGQARGARVIHIGMGRDTISVN